MKGKDTKRDRFEKNAREYALDCITQNVKNSVVPLRILDLLLGYLDTEDLVGFAVDELGCATLDKLGTNIVTDFYEAYVC